MERLAACGLGLMLGSLGAAPFTGIERLDFGTDYLIDPCHCGCGACNVCYARNCRSFTAPGNHFDKPLWGGWALGSEIDVE